MVVYLLILLLNNNVAQLQEEFLGVELYVCIALSFLIQEFSRILLMFFKRLPKFKNEILNFVLQILVSLLLCIGIISLSIVVYYVYVLGFSPNSEDLWLFNSIFCAINLIYILLHVSYEHLFKINHEKLKQEEAIKQNIASDFQYFKQDINPKLLFESLEALLILIDQDKNKSDKFIDHLASIYRYILASKRQQLIGIKEELKVIYELISLFNHLPYRKVNLDNQLQASFLIVPKSLLFLIELILRTSISISVLELKITLLDSGNFFKVSYISNDKITEPFTPKMLLKIERLYAIYSKNKIQVKEEDTNRSIYIPKLIVKTQI